MTTPPLFGAGNNLQFSILIPECEPCGVHEKMLLALHLFSPQLKEAPEKIF